MPTKPYIENKSFLQVSVYHTNVFQVVRFDFWKMSSDESDNDEDWVSSNNKLLMDTYLGKGSNLSTPSTVVSDALNNNNNNNK
mmetsp:Transcript_6337/g.12882  ORF Transcript_6337/g.12882 Transcript_6337/m.12882 type:complete len:83 (-) Transcript_6337:438-686(-)